MVPPKPEQSKNIQCSETGSGIRDQSSGAFLTPGFGIWDTGSGSGMGKKSGSRSRIRIWDGKHGSFFWELRNNFFWLKYLNSLMRIRDPGPGMEKIRTRDQGSRMEKIWIQNPGSGMEKIGSGIWNQGETFRISKTGNLVAKFART